MIDIRIIDEHSKQDINIPNEPFTLYGRMIPSCQDRHWSFETELFPEEQISEMCFPDENYDYDAMCGEHIFIGAYEDDRCVGLAIMREAFLKYMYLYDLKVCRDYRGKGIAKQLILKAKELAVSHGDTGIYTIGQDNNLAACLFYIGCGFYIGGYDTNVYKGSSQEGKADIIFYLDC